MDALKKPSLPRSPESSGLILLDFVFGRRDFSE